MTRTGKIARLPRQVRDELNRRLRDGQKGSQLAAWLNALPKVKDTLAKDFDGRALNKQNVSQWRQGGYQEWLARQELLTQACDLASDTDELQIKTEESLTDHLAKAIGVRLATILARRGADLDELSLQQLRALCPIARMVVQLRRSDHQAMRADRENERWEMQGAQLFDAQRESDLKKHREMIAAPFWARLKLDSLAKAFGGGEKGQRAAAFLLENQFGLEEGALSPKSSPVQPGPKSVKPDQAQPGESQSGSK
jgi:hypothetical protein